jgi:hypothetical protein
MRRRRRMMSKSAQIRKRQRLSSLALSGCPCSQLDHHLPSALDGAAGFPASCIHFRCCRRPILELPRVSVLRLSSPRVFRSPQIPGSMIVSQCVLELPRLPHLPASPAVNLRVAPDLRSACVAFQPISGFPAFVPSGSTGWLILGSRPESRPPAAPSMRLRVSPAPASTAGSMMNPSKLELCILRQSQKMNLRA